MTNEKRNGKEAIISVSKDVEQHDDAPNLSMGQSESSLQPKTPAEMIADSSQNSSTFLAVVTEKTRQRHSSNLPKPSYRTPRLSPSSPKSDPSEANFLGQISRSPCVLHPETEQPVELKRKSSTRPPPMMKKIQTGRDVDYPALTSSNNSLRQDAEKEPLVVMPVTLSKAQSMIVTAKSFREEQKPTC